nr:hypothetical protein [Vibrio cholerae]
MLIARLLLDHIGVLEYFQAETNICKPYPSTVFGLFGWTDENADVIDSDTLHKVVVLLICRDREECHLGPVSHW